MRTFVFLAFAILAQTLLAAERKFDFSAAHENEAPKGFRSTVAGSGKPGDWTVILEDVPPLIPTLNDSSFINGKIGFWTKSDSVSYFTDTKIVYTPREIPAQVIVREMLKKYPRLLGVKIYVPGKEPNSSRLAASKEEKEVGQP